MKAIGTKYVGPTNYKGARIIVDDGDNRMTVSYPYELSGEAVYRHAMSEFLKSARAQYFTDDQRNPDKWVGGWHKGSFVFVYAG